MNVNVNDELDPPDPAAGPDLPPLSAEEEARLRAALAALGTSDVAAGRTAAGDAAAGATAEARREFRTALRRHFVAGTIAAPAAARPRVLRPWAAALAAAALLAVVVIVWLPRPENARVSAWTVVAATADSTTSGSSARAPMIRVDGREVALATLGAGAATLPPGARVELPEGVAVELRLGVAIALETAPGTAFTLPTGGRQRLATIEHGEVRYVTGPAFAGTRLVVESPEARVEVTGTTFVVIAEPRMTCVCVGEGRVHVAARGDTARTQVATHDVPAGRRREIYADGTMSGELPVHAHEAMKLGMLRDRLGAALRTPGR